MSRELISRSPDLKRLVEDGYDVEISGSYLLVNDVPYVGADKTVRRATLASTLKLAGDRTAAPDTHVCLFTGDYPCRADGTEIRGIKHGASNETIREGLVARFSFSNKPPNGYPDYYEKMVQYARIISGPAASLEPLATAQTKPVATGRDEETPFQYLDTASSRAGINVVSSKLRGLRIAIVGLGGTGSYVLDLVAKTPVAEIHLFDDDILYTHNAFRSPGAASIEELRASPQKVDYFAAIYSRMHKKIVPHACRVLAGNLDDLDAIDFVFVCIDCGAARRAIVDRLQERKVKFIDVGMGVELVDDVLIATLRATASTETKSDHLARRLPFADVDEDDEYARNIQIADLNAFNALMAVIKWKKLYGLYQDQVNEHNVTYQLNTNDISNDECP
jgi:hypothetical protein